MIFFYQTPHHICIVGNCVSYSEVRLSIRQLKLPASNGLFFVSVLLDGQPVGATPLMKGKAVGNSSFQLRNMQESSRILLIVHRHIEGGQAEVMTSGEINFREVLAAGRPEWSEPHGLRLNVNGDSLRPRLFVEIRFAD